MSSVLTAVPPRGTEKGPDRRKERILRLPAVIERTGLTKPTIYRREAAGTFPRRERLGPRNVGWYESDVEDFVAAPAGYRAA